MRHDKIVAEVLLIFFVVHVAVAAPAVVRQGPLDVGGAASEKRVIWDDKPPSLPRSGPAGFIPRTPPEVPTPLITYDDETESVDEPLRVPQSRMKGSTLSTSGSSGLSPGLPPQLPHPEPVGLDTTAPLTSPESESLHLAQPGTSGPHLMYSPSSSSSESSYEWFDPNKGSKVTWAPKKELVNIHKYTLEVPASKAPEPEAHEASASDEVPKPTPKPAQWAPVSRLMTLLGFASKKPEPEAHEASASPQPPASHESPHVSTEAPHASPEAPHEISEATHEISEEFHGSPEAPAAPNAIYEASPAISEAPHASPEAPHEISEAPHEISEAPHEISEAPHAISEESHAPPEAPAAPNAISEAPHTISEESHAPPEAPAAPKAPSTTGAKANKFLTDELKQKMKDYAVLGTVAGISIGLLSGVQKEIMGTVSPGAATVGRDLASSDVNGRGSGPLLHGLSDHLRPRKNAVVRGLANLRDEDLLFLSVLTRRALESLD